MPSTALSARSTPLPSVAVQDLPQFVQYLIPAEILSTAVVQQFQYENDNDWNAVIRCSTNSNKWELIRDQIETRGKIELKSHRDGQRQPLGVKVASQLRLVCSHADHNTGHHKSRKACASADENQQPRVASKTKNGSDFATGITSCLTSVSFHEVAPLVYDPNDMNSRKAAASRLENDPLLQTHPTTLTIKWQHNHTMGTFADLRWFSLADRTKERMLHHLEMTGSPAAAARSYESEIEEEFEERSWLELRADHRITPTIRDWYYLADNVRLENHGDRGGEGMLQKLREFAQQHPESCVFEEAEHGDRKDWCLAVQTPIMSRIWELIADAHDILFVDSTASCDLINSSLTLFVSSSSVGVLPTAVAIHSCQTEDCYR